MRYRDVAVRLPARPQEHCGRYTSEAITSAGVESLDSQIPIITCRTGDESLQSNIETIKYLRGVRETNRDLGLRFASIMEVKSPPTDSNSALSGVSCSRPDDLERTVTLQERKQTKARGARRRLFRWRPRDD